MNTVIENYYSDVVNSLKNIIEKEPNFFTMENRPNKKMHSRILGLLCEIAIKHNIKIEIERSWELLTPFSPDNKKRKQWHYAPDLTLYSEEFKSIYGFVDYESVDLATSALRKKQHFYENIKNPNNNEKKLFYMIILTIPDTPCWNNKEDRSINKEDIESLKQSICEISQKGQEFTYYLIVIDHTNIQGYQIENGNYLAFPPKKKTNEGI